MEVLNVYNPENISDVASLPLGHRTSTRAIIIDAQGDIALLYSEKLDYYALPGGGVDAGETNDQSVVRESKEEVGCVVEIIRPLGKVEVRNDPLRVSEVFGYVVKLIGEKGEPELMPDEIEEGFVVTWISPTEAKEIFEKELLRAADNHKQIPMRALSFLKAAFPEAQ